MYGLCRPEPNRARMADSPETSEHTSIRQRIEQALKVQPSYHPGQQPDTLFPFVDKPGENTYRWIVEKTVILFLNYGYHF